MIIIMVIDYRDLVSKRWFLLGNWGNCILSNVYALLHVGIVVSIDRVGYGSQLSINVYLGGVGIKMLPN